MSGAKRLLWIDPGLFGSPRRPASIPTAAAAAAVADDEKGADLVASARPGCRIVVLGKKRMLSLDEDAALFERAAAIAEAVTQSLLQAAGESSGATKFARYAGPFAFALRHHLAGALRPHHEIAALCRDLAADLWLPGLPWKAAALQAVGAPSSPGVSPRPPIRLARRMTGMLAEASSGVAAAAAPGPLLVAAPGGRADALPDGLAGAEPPGVFVADPAQGELRSPGRLAHTALCYSLLRDIGENRAAAAVLAKPLARFLLNRFPGLVSVAEEARQSGRPGMTVFLPNAARSPVMFAGSGFALSGARCVEIRSTLSTRGGRYPDGPLGTLVAPDAAQSSVLGGMGSLAAARGVPPAPFESRVIFAAQPCSADVERALSDLASAVPAGLHVALRPHPADGPAQREWLRRFAASNLAGRHWSVADGSAGSEPGILVSVMSGTALLAASSGIPSLLLPPPGWRRRLWGDGPCPGEAVEPGGLGIAIRALLRDPKARSDNGSEWRRENAEGLSSAVVGRLRGFRAVG